MSGFGNEFISEAIKGSVPSLGANPQHAPLGLVAEQISGSAFTKQRCHNLRSYLYRIQPSAVHGPLLVLDSPSIFHQPADLVSNPNRLRWSKPKSKDSQPNNISFDQGLECLCANKVTPSSRSGSSVYRYYANESMGATSPKKPRRVFKNHDGEFLIVPQTGELKLKTEFGQLEVKPGEIAVLPRGVFFQVLHDGPVYGYICENYGAPFTIPDKGVIGPNSLAAPRDFLYPEASYEDLKQTHLLVSKFDNKLWGVEIERSPFDVVGWFGNYAPYKYDLAKFCTINTVSFDHPDPSIFTVLTSPSYDEGTANVDFVIFPPRWMVAETTFRPPYFHRNIMSEFMGLIHGEYDAKSADEGNGFVPGGASLHNCMSSHGPDTQTHKEATKEKKLTPKKIENTMAFMFESSSYYLPHKQALSCSSLQTGYDDCWLGMQPSFKV